MPLFRPATGSPRRQARRLALLAAPALLALALPGCGGGGGPTPPIQPVTPLLPVAHGQYAYADLGSASSGAYSTGISDAGVISGYFPPTGSSDSVRPFRHTGASPLSAADVLALPPGLPKGTRLNNLSGLNASGTIAGMVSSGSDATVADAFIYDTAFHDLGTLPLPISGRSFAAATAVSDSGTVVGYDGFDDQGTVHAFRHAGTGPLTAADDLGDFAGYPGLQPTAINSAGVVVGGAFANGVLIERAFVYDTGYHDLGLLPDCTTSFATAINRSGIVIGHGFNSQLLGHSFRHAGTGPLTAADDLGQLPGAFGLTANAINAAGDVVGTAGQGGSEGGDAGKKAFLLKTGGTLQNLSDRALVPNLPPGSTLQVATGINSQGQIIGHSNDTGATHVWLLTPAP